MLVDDTEPVYKGRRLSEWVKWTEDQEIDRTPSAEARQAAEAVKTIGPDKVIPFLLKWIKSPKADSVILGGALKSFQILGPSAKSAIPDLTALLSESVRTPGDSERRDLAAEALSYLGPDALPILLEAAKKTESRQKWIMISNLANFGPAGAAAKADVLNWSQSLDHWVRLGALEAYVAIEEHKDALITFLLAALMDANQLVRRNAARYLGDLGQCRPEFFAALVNLLDEPISQTGAILSLGKMGMEKQQTLSLLTEMLHNENPVVRRCAAFALGYLGGQEAFTALMESTDDPDGFVREAVFQSLKRIDPDALQRSGKKFYLNKARRETL